MCVSFVCVKVVQYDFASSFTGYRVLCLCVDILLHYSVCFPRYIAHLSLSMDSSLMVHVSLEQYPFAIANLRYLSQHIHVHRHQYQLARAKNQWNSRVEFCQMIAQLNLILLQLWSDSIAPLNSQNFGTLIHTRVL